MPEDLRGALWAVNQLLSALAAWRVCKLPGVQPLQEASVLLSPCHRGLFTCGILLKMILAGPDMMELVLVN